MSEMWRYIELVVVPVSIWTHSFDAYPYSITAAFSRIASINPFTYVKVWNCQCTGITTHCCWEESPQKSGMRSVLDQKGVFQASNLNSHNWRRVSGLHWHLQPTTDRDRPWTNKMEGNGPPLLSLKVMRVSVRFVSQLHCAGEPDIYLWNLTSDPH